MVYVSPSTIEQTRAMLDIHFLGKGTSRDEEGGSKTSYIAAPNNVFARNQLGEGFVYAETSVNPKNGAITLQANFPNGTNKQYSFVPGRNPDDYFQVLSALTAPKIEAATDSKGPITRPGEILPCHAFALVNAMMVRETNKDRVPVYRLAGFALGQTNDIDSTAFTDFVSARTQGPQTAAKR